ncbi:SIS domain-containing protein [Streptomyces sp. NBC_01498]|uniref:SIS domain-containing protein n=1 Tax=Streptomyces sp. NBC_01498 TaxID=2975870 RepID=UPI002E7C23BB|nr:SIS domain-containing protein [Streptomyces sp. NBC_01498]WTL28006.1 SIS domain-containing protein [Streptomyces sp. NBC_01498]
MSVNAFLRQGFIPFEEGVLDQTGRLTEVAPVLRERALAAAATAGRPARVTFIGIGASLAALTAPAAHLSAHGIPSVRLNAAEAGPFDEDATLIALSQSGRSRETVDVMRTAPGRRLAVVNVTDSPMASAADSVLTLGDLPDSLASTIGFTASAMAVSMLAESWTDGEPSASWLTLGERLAAFLTANSPRTEEIADRLSAASIIDLVAPADQYGAVEGGALLLREVVRVPAASFETRQYLHGLMESTNPSTLHLVLDGPDDGQIVRALGSLGRQIVELRTGAPVAHGERTLVVPVETRSPLEIPIFVAALLQHVALRAAEKRGIDPDEFLFLDTGTKLDDGE